MFARGFAGERNGLTVLDAKTLAVVKQIETAKTPYYATFSPDAKLPYSGYGDGSYVSVFDTATLGEGQAD